MAAISGLLTFTLHFLVVILIAATPSLRCKKSYQLLVNMSCGHTLSGVVIFIGAFKHSNVLSYIVYAGHALSNISMVMLTVDRCVLICWPFRYQSMHSCFHTFMMSVGPVIALLLLLGGVMKASNDSVATNEDVLAVKGFLYGIPLFMLSLLTFNMIIYATVQKQKRAIKSLHIKSTQSHVAENQQSVFKRKKEILAFYVCFGCVITYVVLYFPALLFKLMQVEFGVALDERNFRYMMGIAYLNPISDAIVLVWFNKELRQRIKTLCCCGRGKRHGFSGVTKSSVIPAGSTNSTRF